MSANATEKLSVQIELDYFGYDEPNYTYANGRKLNSGAFGAQRGTRQIRTHFLLTTGDGTAAFKWGLRTPTRNTFQQTSVQLDHCRQNPRYVRAGRG